MLVLTRKKDQALIISDNIEITVLDIQGDQIRLGVEAPKNIKIFRKEIYLEIQEENKNAAKHTPHVSTGNLKSLLNLSAVDDIKNEDEKK
jgi:carbon storage regulator